MVLFVIPCLVLVIAQDGLVLYNIFVWQCVIIICGLCVICNKSYFKKAVFVKISLVTFVSLF